MQAETPLPLNSADLYKNADAWANLYGDDFFFVTGILISDLSPSNDKNYSISGNGKFELSDKVAVNPDMPATGLTPEQAARRAAFLDKRENADDHKFLQNKFPTIADVRNQTNGGEGVYLLAGAVEVFVCRRQEDGPAYQWALFRRTHPATYGFLTGPNGLVSGPYEAQKEAIEELTLADVSSSDKSIVYALVFDDTFPHDASASLAIKKAQAEILQTNLKAQGFSGCLEFKALYTSTIRPQQLGLNENRLSLMSGPAGSVVDTLYGVIGVEKNHHTVIQQMFVTVEPRGEYVIVIDGEPFNRPGGLYTPAALEEALKGGKALPLLLGIAKTVRAHWPRPAGSPLRKPMAAYALKA